MFIRTSNQGLLLLFGQNLLSILTVLHFLVVVRPKKNEAFDLGLPLAFWTHSSSTCQPFRFISAIELIIYTRDSPSVRVSCCSRFFLTLELANITQTPCAINIVPHKIPMLVDLHARFWMIIWWEVRLSLIPVCECQRTSWCRACFPYERRICRWIPTLATDPPCIGINKVKVDLKRAYRAFEEYEIKLIFYNMLNIIYFTDNQCIEHNYACKNSFRRGYSA